MSIALTLDREHHVLTTDRWGKVPHPRPRPDPERPTHLLDVGSVIVVTTELVGACIALGVTNVFGLTETTVDIADDGHVYLTVTADNGRWRWQLFEAHWTEGDGPPCFIGKWPDQGTG